MEEKIDPPTKVFELLLALTFKLYMRFLRKTSWLQEKLKCRKETKVVQKSRTFIFKSNFLYDGGKNRPPNQGF